MKFLLLFLAACCSGTANAQCAYDAIRQYRLEHDPHYAAAVRSADEGWANYLSSRAAQKIIMSGKDTTYEIPIVFHIMHNGDAIGTRDNPSDSQLIELVKYTNATFAATWPSYPSATTGGVHIPIRFVIARVTSSCNATPGIVRVNASGVPGYTTNGLHVADGSTPPGVPDLAVRRLSFWDWNDYLNIWIVHKSDQSLGGWSFGTNYVSDSTSGCGLCILSGYAVAGNFVLPHELGHCLGMEHTFSGDGSGNTCPPATNCASTGDYICDTDPDKRNPDCNATINPCTHTSYTGVQFNIMNYTDCPNRFTAGQRERMLYILQTYTGYLRYSRAGDSVLAPVMVPAGCTATAASPAAPNIEGPMMVSFAGMTRWSFGYNDDAKRAYIDNSCNWRASVAPGFTYPLKIILSGAIQNIRAYLDYNNDGVFQVPGEEIYKGTSAKIFDTIAVNIKIPATGIVMNKPLRLRIISDTVSNAAIGPCGALKTGQAEDYGVTIMKGAAVNAVAGEGWAVYPNPANDHLSISGAAGGTATVVSLIGQRIFSVPVTTARQSISISALPAGTYLLQLTGNDGASRTLRFVKE